MSLWVLGTDTGVGKTVVSGLIALRYARGGPLAYWKPIATGAGAGERDVESLRSWARGRFEVLEEYYCFCAPRSPHLAARLEGKSIEPERILSELVAHANEDSERVLVLEGAGGALVPLTERGDLLADTVAASALPALVVARSTLGTINHTLLTLEALRRRRVEIAGIVLNGPPDADNRRDLERFGRTRIVSEVPPLGGPPPPLARLETAAEAFDAEGVLRTYLGAG